MPHRKHELRSRGTLLAVGHMHKYQKGRQDRPARTHPAPLPRSAMFRTPLRRGTSRRGATTTFVSCPTFWKTRSSKMSSLLDRTKTRKSSDSANGNADKGRKRQKSGPSGSALGTNSPGLLSVADRVLAAERHMSERLSKDLRFRTPITHVYDPLQYAWEAHEWYTRSYGNTRKEILLVGMNPGPWGMAQTGVPFGEVSAVRDWMKVPMSVTIGRPEREHPKRPVEGLSCSRAEVSGDRLWNQWARAIHGDDPHAFFDKYFVYSYCPLLFLEASGKNRPPNVIRATERNKVTEICDEALREVVYALRPRVVVGVGVWATEKTRFALKDMIERGLLIRSLLHPSPASPLANKGWAEVAKGKMEEFKADISTSPDMWASPDKEEPR